MTRSELISAIAADNPHLLPEDVEVIINTIFGQISLALAQGKRVELRRFGIFSISRRSAQMSVNPRTGLPVPVRYKNVPAFRPSKTIQNRMNQDCVDTVVKETVPS